MSRQFPLLGVVLGCTLATLAGCHPQQPFYFHEGGDLSHYRGMATEIEYPDVRTESLGDVTGALPPLTLSNSQPKEVWDLTLEEAIHNALTNSKVMRTFGGAVLGPPDTLLRGPGQVPTVYDPAIAETDPFGGVEGALSAFDAQLAATMSWDRRDTPQNAQLVPGFNFLPEENRQDAATFQAQLYKTSATGGTVGLSHIMGYQLDFFPRFYQRSPVAYNASLEAQVTQPLLRGAGVQFNRIAGPQTPSSPGGPNQGLSVRGVMIARLNTDMALADFEAGVRNLVSDVERAYWDLYFQYRNLAAVVAGRDSALQTWRKTSALATVSAKGGEAASEALARQRYFQSRSEVESALNALYGSESRLRYMMGLTSTDGRLIRPADEPTIAKVAFDWYAIHNEALARSVELRKQRWNAKSHELALIAAKNYLLPRLDAIARYRWLGLGADPTQNDKELNEAYASLLGGHFQEWTIGLQFQMPIGFRREMAGVRNAQLGLARERAMLQEQELELSHQLGFAVRDVDAYYVLSETNFNRRIAAEREVAAVQATVDAGKETIDVLLLSQQRLVQAESDFYRALTQYNQAIAQVHYRKGSLLEYNGVYLAEGPWPAKAYFDACRLARARDAAHYLDYGFTQPRVVSRGPYEQHPGEAGAAIQGEADNARPGTETPEPTPEVIPAPQPSPPQASPEAPASKPADQPQAARPRAQEVQVGAGSGAGDKTAQQRTAPKSYDLGAMDLSGLAERNAAGQSKSAGRWSTVRQTNYEESAAAARPSGASRAQAKPPGNDGTSTLKSDPGHEPVANSPTAEPDRPASGWKRVQH